MTNAFYQGSVIVRCALWASFVYGSTLGAQVPSSRDVDSVLARAAAALERELASLRGTKYVRASEFCGAGPVQFVCDLDRPVSNARKQELDKVFAGALERSMRSAPSQEALLSAREVARKQADADARRQLPTNPAGSVVRSRDAARAANETKCGAPERWSIISEVMQVSVRADSVLVNMYVTQMGPLAGCGGGAQMWKLVAVRQGEGFVLGPLTRGAHFELMFEVPKQTPR